MSFLAKRTVDAPITDARSIVSTVLGTMNAHTCFVYGAFVIEDPKHYLFYTLLNQPTTYSRRTYSVLPTHDAFIKGHPRLHGDLRSSNMQWEAPIDPPITGICEEYCGGDDQCMTKIREVEKRVALFYAFEVASDLNKDGHTRTLHEYLYLKLEDHAYYSPHHALSAFSRYYLGKPNKNKFFESRREDEDIREGPSVIDAQRRQIQRAHTFYDSNVRSGNELFVSHWQYVASQKRHDDTLKL